MAGRKRVPPFPLQNASAIWHKIAGNHFVPTWASHIFTYLNEMNIQTRAMFVFACLARFKDFDTGTRNVDIEVDTADLFFFGTKTNAC